MSFILGYFIGQLVLFFLLMMVDGGDEYTPTYFVEYKRDVNWSPLVRCKDCKWFVGERCRHKRSNLNDSRKPTDFCSWGERREDV